MFVYCKVVSVVWKMEADSFPLCGLAFYSSRESVLPLVSIPDLCAQSQIDQLCRYAELINSSNVDEIHVYDIIEDLLLELQN